MIILPSPSAKMLVRTSMIILSILGPG